MDAEEEYPPPIVPTLDAERSLLGAQLAIAITMMMAATAAAAMSANFFC
ncbi:hypothetical protein Achl_3968 (plasmid) [Pseudarthrobacter chlorophenolicus A6]|uniref:Uncharacterized protein n=1 Tax=Pseudarthrobacter chlorophenolicus (strain ATCC 700700 / DSM 12829 / CIP 107037 / JCM 12360 / KCTC 9906 / NCIMB 13794 / A6) TaxID=452863 RepID=B8HHM2_PSECP|nr:hypothetical protein Achl_3968 [Pseudarthrobacter chlorophenolicus A6]SDQ18669.1 hypothetical protein SAMN04489738_0579 [Pseudarthrobacter chlorophenolicus]